MIAAFRRLAARDRPKDDGGIGRPVQTSRGRRRRGCGGNRSGPSDGSGRSGDSGNTGASRSGHYARAASRGNAGSATGDSSGARATGGAAAWRLGRCGSAVA